MNRRRFFAAPLCLLPSLLFAAAEEPRTITIEFDGSLIDQDYLINQIIIPWATASVRKEDSRADELMH